LTEKFFGRLGRDLAPRDAGDGWHAFFLEDGEGFVSEGLDVGSFGKVEG